MVLAITISIILLTTAATNSMCGTPVDINLDEEKTAEEKVKVVQEQVEQTQEESTEQVQPTEVTTETETGEEIVEEESNEDKGLEETSGGKVEAQDTTSEKTADEVVSRPVFDNFTLLDIEGKEVSLSDYTGKAIVINFWGTWCPPCREEIPHFVEVATEYKDTIQFIGVSVGDKLSELKQFVEENNINYPTLVDGSIDSLSDQWNISVVPTTFILNQNKEIINIITGSMSKEMLINEVEKAL